MNRPINVLLVDDDPDLLELLGIRLRRTGFQVTVAATAQAAIATLPRLQPDVVVTDLRMAPVDGLGLLAAISERYPLLPVILLTAHGTIPDAIAATERGAFAFLAKPINDVELIQCIRTAAPEATGDLDDSDAASACAAAWRSSIITRSPLMNALLREAQLAAASDASILIQSESGTGKEVLAKAIHQTSPRAAEAFVAVNCTAIPETLFESELFGHKKGAFTGADRNRQGLIQQAHGGTLFLDEIGDMPMSLQAKLLRALQERCIRPVGSDRDLAVDVRIITATHRDLEAEVRRGEFREDLYYRLGVITLELPPLAARREDIPLLASHFLKEFAARSTASGFAPAAMERLVAAPWPGNVRQLANVVQQCAVLGRTRLIPASLVERALRGRASNLATFAVARDQFELEYLSNLLQVTAGNVSQAARLAGRNRSEFYSLLKKHALEPAQFRVDEGAESP